MWITDLRENKNYIFILVIRLSFQWQKKKKKNYCGTPRNQALSSWTSWHPRLSLLKLWSFLLNSSHMYPFSWHWGYEGSIAPKIYLTSKFSFQWYNIFVENNIHTGKCPDFLRTCGLRHNHFTAGHNTQRIAALSLDLLLNLLHFNESVKINSRFFAVKGIYEKKFRSMPNTEMLNGVKSTGNGLV